MSLAIVAVMLACLIGGANAEAVDKDKRVASSRSGEEMKAQLFVLLMLTAPALTAVTQEVEIVQARDNPRCPEDDSGSYFTGKTRTSSAGYLMYQYKCMSYGHLFWVRSS